MIRLVVKYQLREGLREEFLGKVKGEGLQSASEKDAGNIQYDFYLSEKDPNELVLLEAWESDEAIGAHCEAPHFKRMREVEKEYAESVNVEKYVSE